MNNITITGRLSKEPELRQTQTGKSVCSFSVAVRRTFPTQDADTDFFDCVAWNKTAEFIANYFHKGNMIGIIGEMNCEKWTDNSGNTRYSWKLKASNADFCGGKSDNQTQPAPSNQSFQPVQQQQLTDLSDFEDILSDGPTPF